MEAASPSAVLPDAAAVSLPPNSADETRRSGRDCKSTTMIIDGHVVLTKNNYVLKGGSYEYGVHTADAPKQRKRKEPPKSRDTQSTKTPRRVTPTEQKRSNFNDNLKGRVARKAAARLSFLAQNLNVLKPFIEPSVVRKLEAVDIVPAKEQPLYLQPDAIEADLRDYQLEGLNWMVDMYRQNLSCILGDEMVRALLYVFVHLIDAPSLYSFFSTTGTGKDSSNHCPHLPPQGTRSRHRPFACHLPLVCSLLLVQRTQKMGTFIEVPTISFFLRVRA